jgi:hypothetical protein
MPPPIGVRRRAYNQDERRVIDEFKEEYMKTTTPAERKTISQVKIFPAIFEYWSKIGVDLTPDEMDKRSEVSWYSFKSLKTADCITTPETR